MHIQFLQCPNLFLDELSYFLHVNVNYFLNAYCIQHMAYHCLSSYEIANEMINVALGCLCPISTVAYPAATSLKRMYMSGFSDQKRS